MTLVPQLLTRPRRSAVVVAALSPASFSQADVGAVWVYQRPEPAGTMAVTESGDTLATYAAASGATVVVSLDAAGEVRWEVPIAGARHRIASHPSGQITVAGEVEENDPAIPGALGQRDIALIRLDSAGQLLWQKRVGGAGFNNVSAAASDGEQILLGGTSDSDGFGGPDTESAAFFGRFNSTGTQLQVTRFRISDDTPSILDIARTSNGAYIMVGRYFDGSSFNSLAWRATVDTAGQVTQATGGSGQLTTVEVLANDDLVMAGDGYEGIASTAVVQRAGAINWMDEPFSGLEQSFGYAARVSGPNELLYACTIADDNFINPPFNGLHRRALSTGAILERRRIRLRPGQFGVPVQFDLDRVGSARALLSRTSDINGGFIPGSEVARVAPFDPIGSQVCAGEVNSTGGAATLEIAGSAARADNSLTLFANGLPPQQSVLFLVSASTDIVTNLGGGEGTLCLGGSIGRFVQPGQIKTSSIEGRAAVLVDLAALPIGGAPRNAVAGETWFFQAWHRDTIPAQTSNLTSAVSVTFD